MKICFYGSGSEIINKNYTDEAYNLGCEISKRKHTLVFGGGDTGMMGACARGVHDNDGESIGIAPNWIKNFEPLCKQCSEFIYVDTMGDFNKMLKMLDEMDEKGFLYKQESICEIANNIDEIFNYL